MLVAYPPTRDCPPTVDVLRERLARNDVDVLDVLLVSEGRWWSLLCTSADCCPPVGHQVSEVVSELEVSRIVEGAPAVAMDRETLVARYALIPTDTPDEESLDCVDTSGTAAERAGRALEALRRLSHRPDTADRALVMVLVQDLKVRDLLLTRVVESDGAEALVDAFAMVAVRTPSSLLPVVAGAAAAVSTALGTSSVRTWCLVEHAGDDSLAALISEVMACNINPGEVRALFTHAAQVICEAETLDAATDSVR